MRPLSVHVISPAVGFGNKLDLKLVGDLLENSGFAVTCTPVITRSKGARVKRMAEVVLQQRGRFDLNVFLAPIFPEWLPLARKNVLIPNAEGFAPHNHKYLRTIDVVLGKTRLTERVFRELGCRSEYMGFISKDQIDESVPRDYTRFFHACSSYLKGTKRLVEVWQKHPEWPELVAVINHNHTMTEKVNAPNIRAIYEPQSDEDIRRLQNSYAAHLCTSEAEGFGHYILESMSCHALVFSTDGPPMNELVQPSRGVLLDVEAERIPLALSHRYFFKKQSLEQQVERVLQMDRAEIDQLGAAARAYFLESNRLFTENFPEFLRKLVKE